MTQRQKEYLSISLGLAGAILGIFAPKMGLGTGAVWVAVVIMAVGLALRYAWHRCPHCRRYLGRHWEEFCPYCGVRIDYDAR